MTGFSHGAAGIIYALSCLYAASGEHAFLGAAAEGVAYEAGLFDPEQGNWPDFRQDAPSFMSAWCHGAAGIGLARLGSLGTLDSDQTRRDIEAALATAEEQSVDKHIACCGAMGRVEFLLSAGLELRIPRLVEAAHGVANLVLRQKRQRGSFLVHRLLPASVYNPSLFQGTAGIGYMLLRLSQPDVVPPFLLWR
jgi:lantibiotic modifying enzyme